MSLTPDAVGQLIRYSDVLHGRGVRSPAGEIYLSLLHSIQTGPGADPGTEGGSFSGSKAAEARG
jgi:hypothetical protein